MAIEAAEVILRGSENKQPRHLVSATDFYPGELERLFKLTTVLKDQAKDGPYLRHLNYLPPDYAIKIFMEEPSTRTKDSMERAAELLGAKPSVESNGAVTSGLAKLEVRRSMARMWQQYGYNMVAWRAAQEDAFAGIVNDPEINFSLVNLGDGPGEHPTQFLLDGFTMSEKRKQHGQEMEDMTVVIAGMPSSRVTRSWMKGFAKQYPDRGITLHLVSHPDLLPSPRELDDLEKAGLNVVQSGDLLEAVRNPNLAFVCGTRYQAQHDLKYGDIADLDKRIAVARSGYDLQRTDLSEEILDAMPEGSFYMHPLPNGPELSDDFWDHPKVLAFNEQPRNGLYTRMALILDTANPEKADELLNN